MSIRTRSRAKLNWIVAAALLLVACFNEARADGPGPWPDEASPPPVVVDERVVRYGDRGAAWPRPPRRVTGGPGYVGSDWGLGKPSYYGIGPRPDWGRSSID